MCAGEATERSKGDGVVTAEHDWRQPFAHGARHESRNLLTRLLDRVEEPHALAADRCRLGNRAFDVAPVDDTAAEAVDPRRKAGVPDRRRPHVHTAPASAQVEARPDEHDRSGSRLRVHPTETSVAMNMEGADGHGIRVLLADDDADFLAALRELIDRQPELHVVGAAANGLEAIEQADELVPDAIVIDVHMPLLDGVTAVARLRRDHPSLCVIALTGDDAPELHEAVREAGADGVLVKSELVETLVDRVADARSPADASR